MGHTPPRCERSGRAVGSRATSRTTTGGSVTVAVRLGAASTEEREALSSRIRSFDDAALSAALGVDDASLCCDARGGWVRDRTRGGRQWLLSEEPNRKAARLDV